MHIPAWMWWFGVLAGIGVLEHVQEKRELSKKAKNGVSKPVVTTNVTQQAAPAVGVSTPTSNHRNHWDGMIDGKSVTPGSKWDLLRKDVLARDHYKCTNCGKTSNLTVDHKVPLSLGGTNLMSNLTTLCKDCHEYKDQRKIFDQAFDAKDNYGEDHKLTRKVAALSKAINSGTRMSIAYTDYKGHKTTRTISPRRLAKDKGRIYCIAFCHLRNDKRTFRLSRIEI